MGIISGTICAKHLVRHKDVCPKCIEELNRMLETTIMQIEKILAGDISADKIRILGDSEANG